MIARIVALILVGVALAGCVGEDAAESAAAAETEPEEWLLESCDIAGFSHSIESEQVDALLPPGLEPADAVELLYPEGAVPSGYGLAGILGFDCVRPADGVIVGFSSLGISVKRPDVLPDLDAALINSHWKFGHTTDSALDQWLTAAGVPTGEASSVHVVTAFEADHPAGQTKQDAWRSSQLFIRIGEQTIFAAHEGGVAADSDGRSAPLMMRVWLPSEDGLRTLEVDFANVGTVGSGTCQHDSNDPYAETLGRSQCTSSLSYTFPDHDVVLRAFHYPEVKL